MFLQNEKKNLFCIIAYLCQDYKSGRKGTMVCLLHSSPKFYNNVFLFVGLSTFGTFIEFWLVGSLSSESKRFNYLLLSIEGGILWIIIWDVHQFIGHYNIIYQLTNFTDFPFFFVVMLLQRATNEHSCPY